MGLTPRRKIIARLARMAPLDVLRDAAGTCLLGNVYWSAFDRDFWRCGQSGFWNLKRLQNFQEPDDDSWAAFSRGDWDTAMNLLARRRDSLRQYYRRIDEHGFKTWQVRVVEEPLTDYMRWELRLLRLRDELGGRTRLVQAADLRLWERGGVLPEIVAVGDDVAYCALYDETGLQLGGIRYTDPEFVEQCRLFIRMLYDRAMPIGEYLSLTT